MHFLQTIQTIDFDILNYIQAHMRSAVLDTVFVFITKLGDHANIWSLAAVLLLFSKKYRKFSIMLAAALILSSIMGDHLLKPVFERSRPYVINPDVQLLIPRLKSYSFPSGHTLSSFTAATVLYYANKTKFGIPAFILAVLIAFSRLYLYVHYPSDVLAGAAIGILIALFVIGVYKSLKKIKRKKTSAR